MSKTSKVIKAVSSKPAPAAVPEEKNKFQLSGKVKVIKGSILTPHDAGLRFVLNINNLAGKVDSPLYAIFDKKWPKVKQEAKGWYNARTGAYKLGAVPLTTAVQSDVWILHLLCQDAELKTSEAGLTACLKELCKMAKYERASVHVSSLLPELVPELSESLQKELVDKGVSVSYYEEPK